MYRSAVYPKLQSCWDTAARPWPKGKSMCHTEIIAWRSPLRDAVATVGLIEVGGVDVRFFRNIWNGSIWQHPGPGNVVVQDGKVRTCYNFSQTLLCASERNECQPQSHWAIRAMLHLHVHFTWWPQIVLHVVPFPCCKATSITQVTKSLEAIAERFLGWQCQDLGADLKGDGGIHETDEKNGCFSSHIYIYIIHMSYPFHFASALSTVSTPVFSKGPAVFGLFPLETFGNMARHDAMPEMFVNCSPASGNLDETSAAWLGEVIKKWLPAGVAIIEGS